MYNTFRILLQDIYQYSSVYSTDTKATKSESTEKKEEEVMVNARVAMVMLLCVIMFTSYAGIQMLQKSFSNPFILVPTE